MREHTESERSAGDGRWAHLAYFFFATTLDPDLAITFRTDFAGADFAGAFSAGFAIGLAAPLSGAAPFTGGLTADFPAMGLPTIGLLPAFAESRASFA